MTQRQDDSTTTILFLFMGGVAIAGLALQWAFTTSFADDAPYTMEFSPQVNRGQIHIDSDSVRFLGQSGRAYRISELGALPTVYLAQQGEEVRLGRFEYG